MLGLDRCLLLMLGHLLVSFCLFGQDASLEFYNSDDGLAGNRIWGIAQDDEGYLWVNTGHLNRFDGQRFENYKTNDELIFEKITLSSSISFENKLVTFTPNGFYFIDPNTGEYSVDSLSEILGKDDQINTRFINQGKNGVATFFIFNSVKEEVRFFVLKDESVSEIAAFKDIDINFENGFVIFTSDNLGNIYFLNKNRDKLFQYDNHGALIDEVEVVVTEGAYRLEVTEHNTILLSQNDSLFYLEPNMQRFLSHPINEVLRRDSKRQITDIFEAADGNIWLCDVDRGLWYYDVSTRQVVDLTDEVRKTLSFRLEMLELFQDRSGVMWVRTLMGLLKIVPQNKLFKKYFDAPNGLCEGHCSFRGIAEDDLGNVYASYYNGLLKINHLNKETSTLPSFSSELPFDLLYDNGFLFTNNGKLFDLATSQMNNNNVFNLRNEDVGNYAKTTDGDIIWAYQQSVYLRDHANWHELYHFEDRMQLNIEDLEYDSKRDWVWLCLDGQLYYMKSGGRIKPLLVDFDDATSLYVICMLFDDIGNLWLGTRQGLAYYNPESGDLKVNTEYDGLSNNYVVGLLAEGDSALWISTNYGLSRMQISSETFVNFYEQDGLPHNEFNRASYYYSNAGDYYFGTLKGLVSFQPRQLLDELRLNRYQLQLNLVSCQIYDPEQQKMVEYIFSTEDVIRTLNHDNITLSMKFSLMDYSSDVDIQYAYFLDGHDVDWSNPSEVNIAQYSKLSPGEYTFRVKALNANGQWISDELSIPISVRPPWWKTWWAYLFYFCALVCFSIIIYRFIVNRVKLQQQLILEKDKANRLKDLDGFKSRLYTNLTHELRTPLTVILGMANNIRENPDGFLENGVELINRNGRSMLALINQLLDLSKLKNRAFKLNLNYGNIIPNLEYIVESFHSYAEQQDVSLSIDKKVTSCFMDCDGDQIQQVLINLVSNAIKFTPKQGSIIVKVDVLDANDKQSLVFEVCDSGIGIDEKDIQHVFDRFYQVDNSSTRQAEGTGIGLAHANELVKLMNGTISVSSELGNGSVFSVKLPITDKLKYKASDSLANIDVVLPATAKPGARQKVESLMDDKPRLLIIEDHKDVVTYLNSCLEETYQLEVAYNGKDGVLQALELIPDLIISDVMMPEKDGYQVCKELKQDERTNHIPIVLLTARVDTESRIEGLEQGADAYLAKPFNKKELLVRLAKLNEQRKRMIRKFRKTVLEGNVESAVKADQMPQESAFVLKIKTILEENYADEHFGLPLLCEAMNMSRPQLFRKLKALTGVAPSVFIKSYRLQKAKVLLSNTDLNISQVAYQTGFKDPSYFTKVFKGEFGISPSSIKSKT